MSLCRFSGAGAHISVFLSRKLVTLVPGESNRRQMSEAFVAAHGTEVADIIMDHLPPAGWSDLARRSDLAEQALLFRNDLTEQSLLYRRDLDAFAKEVRSEIAVFGDKVRGEIAGVRDEMRGEVAGLRDEVRGEFAAVRKESGAEFVSVRGEIANLRKEMNEGFRSQLKWVVGTILALFLGSTTLISTLVVTVK